MKIKSLPISVLALFFGISTLCFFVKSFAQNATFFPLAEQFDDQEVDDLRRMQVNQITGTVDLNDVQTARLQAAQFNSGKKSTAAMNWVKKGPNNMAGAITSIVSEDLSGQIIYVGSEHGGVFKSTDGGNRWNPLPAEGDVNLFVKSLAISTAKKLYVGTGGDFPAQGIWTSENGSALKLMPDTDSWGMVNRIVVYTKNGTDFIYAATDQGLMFFNGSSWKICTGYNEVNILVNGDFSSWSDNGRPSGGWTVNPSDQAYVIQSSIAHSAPYSCQLKNENSEGRRLFSASYKIISEYDYHVRFWLRGSGELRVGIWNGTNKEDENNYSYYDETINATDSWKLHEITLKAPTGIRTTGQFVFSYAKTSDNHILVDDVELFVGDMTFNTKVTDIDIAGEDCVITSLVNNFGSFCYISNELAANKFVGAAFDKTLSGIENIAVAVSPSNPDTVYISVAAIVNNQYSLAGVYVSGDKENRQDWRKIFQAAPGSGIDPLGGNINKIFVDPLNSGAVYIVSTELWQGIKYSETGFYDFGLKALMGSLHSNVHDMFMFESPYGTSFRNAYVVTDGGVTLITIDVNQKYYLSSERNRNFYAGSFSHIAAHNKNGVIGATPTLAMQGVGDSTNNEQNARPIWAAESGSRVFTNEGKGGPCFASWIDERFYIMSRSSGNASSVRRSNDRGYSYQPASSSAEQWLTKDMLANSSYNRPMLMWETFNAEYTADTVEFKAIYGENFKPGDKYVFPRSKNLDYPMQVNISKDFTDGETRKYPDLIQNRVFYGQEDKVWMTRGAVDLSNLDNLIEWYKIATLREKDSIACFAISDNGNHLFIGSRKGNIYRIDNILYANDSATAIAGKETCVLDTVLVHSFEGRYITSISVNPTNANNIIVTLGNYGNEDYVYESSNVLQDNALFSSIQGKLPKAPVYASLISKGGNKQYKIVGTEFGLYYKEGDAEWVPESKIGHIPVMALTQVTTERSEVNVKTYDKEGLAIIENYPSNYNNYLGIFAGTYGNGIFYFDDFIPRGIDTVDPDGKREMLMVYPNPVTSNTTLDIDMREGTTATVQIYDLQGRRIEEFQTSSNKVNMDFTDKAAGVYLIRVIQGNKAQSAKVIKY